MTLSPPRRFPIDHATMKTLPFLLFTGLCALGWTAGRWAGQESTATAGARLPSPTQAGVRKLAARETATAQQKEAAMQPVPAKPREAMATLLALPDGDLYTRLLRWLTEADAVEIAAFWQEYRTKGEHPQKLSQLVFLNWTRLDPQAAIIAAREAGIEATAWWAWAAVAPEEALKQATAIDSEMDSAVFKGIGNFHPEWLQNRWDQIPENRRRGFVAAVGEWGDGAEAETTLKLMLKHSGSLDPNTFTALISQYPLAAYDLLHTYGIKSAIAQVAGSLATSAPDLLQELATREPPGENKRQLEAAMFRQVLASSPDEALKLARATTAPRVAAERLAAVAARRTGQQSGETLGLLDEIFSRYPDALDHHSRIAGKDESLDTSDSSADIDTLVEKLESSHSRELLALPALDQTFSPDSDHPTPWEQIQDHWAEQDVDAYAAWVGEQTDPQKKAGGIDIVIHRKASMSDYAGAVRWAVQRDEKAPLPLTEVFNRWVGQSPEEAAAWLRTADLPAERKAELRDLTEPAGN